MDAPRQLGRYLIREEIGRGGMGVVYRAEDPTLGRTVAIKVISTPPGQAVDQELESRFLREARLAARISHPGVVTVHDAGNDGGVLFLVMELIEGESLKQRLENGFWPSRAQALGLVAKVADALAAAHALGVVHRDVKPANVLLTRVGGVKVSDFGVAKALGDATEMTRAGTTLGSPAYMAPEQVKGAPLDTRVDLFSLGVVLFELLLRRRPFASDTITTLVYQILHHDPLGDVETLSTLGHATAEFLGQCLAKEPEQRIADAATFVRRALELAPQQPAEVEDVVPTVAFFPPPPPPPPPPSPTGPASAVEPTLMVERKPEPIRAKPGWVFVVVVAITVAGIVLAVGGWTMFMRLIGERSGVEGDEHPPAAVTPAADAAELPVAAPTKEPMSVGGPSPRATTLARPVVPPRATAISDAAEAPPPAVTPTREPDRTPTPTLAEVFICSRAADFDVEPDDAEIEVNGERIGIADDWDDAGGGSLYTFPAPGTYYVRLSRSPGYRPVWVKIVVTPHASREIAEVDTELEEIRP